MVSINTCVDVKDWISIKIRAKNSNPRIYTLKYSNIHKFLHSILKCSNNLLFSDASTHTPPLHSTRTNLPLYCGPFGSFKINQTLKINNKTVKVSSLFINNEVTHLTEHLNSHIIKHKTEILLLLNMCEKDGKLANC